MSQKLYDVIKFIFNACNMSSNAYVCISCFVVFYQIDTFPRHKWSMICVKPNRHTSASWMINVLRQLTFVNNDPEVQIQMRQLCLRFFAVHCSFVSVFSVSFQFCLSFVSGLSQFCFSFVWFSSDFLFVSFSVLSHLCPCCIFKFLSYASH